MAIIYATLIVKGKKTYAQVPEKIKPQVKQVLIDLECEDLITEEFPLEQAGEAYRLMASGNCGKVAVVFPED